MKAVAARRRRPAGAHRGPRAGRRGRARAVRACGLCGTDVQKLGQRGAGTVSGTRSSPRTRTDGASRSSTTCPAASATRCRAGHETTCERFPRADDRPRRLRGARPRCADDRAPRRRRRRDRHVRRAARLRAPGARAHPARPRARRRLRLRGPALRRRRSSRRGDDVFAADPLAHRLELALGYGASRPTASRSTPPSSARTRASTARSPRSSRAARCSSSRGSSIRCRSTSRHILRRELDLVGSCSATPAAMREAIALLPALDPIPTVTLPLERFAEGLDLYRSHEASRSSSRREGAPLPRPRRPAGRGSPAARARPGDVLVQVEVALTDGTDAKAFRRGHPLLLAELPSPFGHEFCGIDVATGRRVVAANSAPCGECPPCRRGEETLCENLRPFLNGAYAEYLLVPARIAERNLLPVPHGARPRGRRDGRAARLLPARGRAGRDRGGTDRSPCSGPARSASCSAPRRRTRARTWSSSAAGRSAASSPATSAPCRATAKGADVVIEAVGTARGLARRAGARAPGRHRPLLRRPRELGGRHVPPPLRGADARAAPSITRRATSARPSRSWPAAPTRGSASSRTRSASSRSPASSPTRRRTC